ncbi:MAG TPA: hypothetical protein VM433_08875 [Mycobacteriales bacterium]|nr:hypothetical protein [Mycobacteriales bacterium]
MPTALKNMDDRVLGRKGRKRDAEHPVADGDHPEHEPARSTGTADPARSGRTGNGVPAVLAVVYRISRLVFLLLALVTFLGIVLTYAPTNEDNVIVRTVLGWAETVAGPFRDVFTSDEARRELLYNYALATGVYLLAASLIGKLPTGGTRTAA